MIKEYIKYLKGNPEKYWFKRKTYGWGWTPARWQGWVSILVYIILIILLSLTIDESSPLQEAFFAYILPVALLTIILIYICYKTGEKPKWQWGPTKKSKK